MDLEKLLYHEYSVNKGRILINNQDVTQIIPQNFYDKFAIASTDTKIFNMTLRDNLLLANSDASETMLYDACKKAEIYDWIISLPDKLDFKVGENGEKLSGGQQERLIVARLFLKKASIYILDEALSEISLDDEIGILNRLFKNNPDAIFFIVSHRIKQLPNVEEIVIGA